MTYAVARAMDTGTPLDKPQKPIYVATPDSILLLLDTGLSLYKENVDAGVITAFEQESSCSGDTQFYNLSWLYSRAVSMASRANQSPPALILNGDAFWFSRRRYGHRHSIVFYCWASIQPRESDRCYSLGDPYPATNWKQTELVRVSTSLKAAIEVYQRISTSELIRPYLQALEVS